jgi:peptide/nickel transport system ATP-binding protein
VTTAAAERPLVVADELTKYFPVRESSFGRGHRGGTTSRGHDVVHAVDGVSLAVQRGETLGVVGESGCGKSTLARLLVRLHEPTSGTVTFDGVDITTLSRSELRPFRREMQMIFQDPYASLNPRKRVVQLVGDPLRIHRQGSSAEIRQRVRELLEVVGLSPDHINRYPHEFSGGQRQRIGIARALALRPRLIVADEPVSALDVSIQAQVVNLFHDLQDEFGLTYVFIAHDLGVVRHVSNRIAVMYLGVIVEVSPADELYDNPLHPYTISLLSAVPIPDPVVERERETILLAGDLPSPANPPPACRFHTRCPYVQETRCRDEVPALRELAPGHVVACHWAEDIKAGKIEPKEIKPVFERGPAVAGAYEPPPT